MCGLGVIKSPPPHAFCFSLDRDLLTPGGGGTQIWFRRGVPLKPPNQ